MTKYSHSKLGTYLQCKQKYKFQYVDKIKTEIETIEAFMGKLVHETLEKLYKDLKFQKINSKEELIGFFDKKWTENWHDKVVITKKDYTAENYKQMGKKFIADYYEHYKPFNSLITIGLETQDFFPLENSNNYHVRIDRLACDKDGNYYICDYKTNNQLKAQEELDEDRQLAMYSLFVKQKYPDAKSVKLVWYFLAFDKEMLSERSDEQLSKLREQTEMLIREVGTCTDFPTNVTALCDYCVYRQICPAWKHEIELEQKTSEEFKDDEGVHLVDAYGYYQEQKREAEEQLEKLKERLIGFARHKEINMIYGTEKKASVKEYNKAVFPEDKEKLLELIKEKGLYEEFSSINYLKLGSSIVKGEVDEEIEKLVKKEKDYRVSLSKKRGAE